MNHVWVFVAVALVVGAFLPLQAGINAHLRTFAGQPAWAALASFAIGTAVLLAYHVASRQPWPAASSLAAAPWWAWLGGFLGAAYVLSAVVLAPRLGAATMVGLFITGQMLASIVLDHFGLVGYPEHHVSPLRVLGAVLLLAGVGLVRAF